MFKVLKAGFMVVILTLIGMQGCTKPPKLKSVGGVDGLPASSIKHFETHVFPLIGTQGALASDPQKQNSGYYCSGCHHSSHHTTLDASHRYVIEHGWVKFERIKSSDAAVKVGGSHNCWSDCLENSKALEDAFQAWLDAIVADGFQIPEQDVGIKSANSTSFADTSDHTLVLDPAIYLGGPISTATTNNTWATIATDGNDGALSSYVVSPPRNNPVAAGAGGTAAFNIDVPAAGTYYAFVRVKFPNDNQDLININAGNNNFDLTGDPTNDEWGWRQAMTGNDNDQPRQINLAAGPQTITVRERSGGASLSYLLISPQSSPNMENLNLKFFDVEVDISDVAGTTASIIATIWPKAQGEEQNKVIGVKELRVKSDKPLAIRGIKPLINGFYNDNHATYTAVDGIFGTPDGQVVETGGSTGSTWLGDISKDSLGFAFESISVAN